MFTNNLLINLLVIPIVYSLVYHLFVQSVASDLVEVKLKDNSTLNKSDLQSIDSKLFKTFNYDKQSAGDQFNGNLKSERLTSFPKVMQTPAKQLVSSSSLSFKDDFKLNPIIVKNRYDDRQWKPDWSRSKTTKSPKYDKSWKVKDPWKLVKDSNWNDWSSTYRYKKGKKRNRNGLDAAKKWSRPVSDIYRLETSPIDKRPIGVYSGRPVPIKKIKSNWKSYPTKDYDSLRRLIRTKYMPIYWRYWKRGRKLRRPKRYHYFRRHQRTSIDDLRTLLWLDFVEPMGQWKFWHLFGSGIDAFWPMYIYDVDDEDDYDEDEHLYW
uniref:Uncharacterized protein n=1 Tax=Tetranychus urticae TaxID=32264 RepID=T1KUG2_TETUR